MAIRDNIWWTQRDTSSKREAVRQYYTDHLGCTQQECADALGISRRTVYRHLTAMRAEWAMQGERDAA